MSVGSSSTASATARASTRLCAPLPCGRHTAPIFTWGARKGTQFCMKLVGRRKVCAIAVSLTFASIVPRSLAMDTGLLASAPAADKRAIAVSGSAGCRQGVVGQLQFVGHKRQPQEQCVHASNAMLERTDVAKIVLASRTRLAAHGVEFGVPLRERCTSRPPIRQVAPVTRMRVMIFASEAA